MGSLTELSISEAQTPSVLRQMALAGSEARGIQEVVGCTMTNRGWAGLVVGEDGLGDATRDADMDILESQVRLQG